MTRHTWIIEADVDEEALARRVAEKPNDYPMVDDPEEFTWDDLKAAIDRGYVENVAVQ